METPQNQNNTSLKTLIELGTHGHYPLFTSEWINEVEKRPRRFTNIEKKKAKKITQRLLQHRSFDRQKTVLFSLPEDDRRLFIQSFFKLVEGKVLDNKPQLH